jgi:DNA-binding transcriptional regulator YiaG
VTSRRELDIAAARRKLGLSIEGLRILLRLGENSGKTIRRWQSGEQDVPGPVEAYLELLLRSPEARQAAGVDELARRYPAFTPGRPVTEDD